MPSTSRLSIRRIDERSLGFIVAGASNVAAQWMLDAMHEQAPTTGSRDAASAWAVGLYSHNLRRGRQFASDHGIIHVSEDLDSLLARPEVKCVYVGNHPRHHAETVRTALAAQKHVLCEPPLALTWDEAETLRQMAANRSLVLAMNYTWRAVGAAHRLHDLLVDDAIGEIMGGQIRNSTYLPPLQQGWRLHPNGGGVLLDRTLHTIDLVQALLHTSVREVYAHTVQGNERGIEEAVIGWLRTVSGAVVQFHDAFLLPHAPATLEFQGTNGSILARNCAVGGEAQMWLARGNELNPQTLAEVNPFRAALARFVGAVRGLTPPLATAAEDVHNLVVLAAIRQSLLQRTPVLVR